jgi:hypothetical protein
MKTKSILIASLFMGLLSTSCEKSEIPDRTDVANGARICFVNLSPDATTNEMNLYFDGLRVTSQQSTVVGRLRGIPFRSSYPGVITIAPTATTAPASYIGAEYFVATEGNRSITVKDTLYTTGHTTFLTSDFNFEKNKYYSAYAMDAKTNLSLVIVPDDVAAFGTPEKVKVRCVNALTGTAGVNIDIWMIHQPAAGKAAIPPYKIASDLVFKSVTQFTDTITSGAYKWVVTKAGAVPSENLAPTELGKPYTLSFLAADRYINLNVNTTFAQRTTYSFMIYGQVGAGTARTPYGSLFRHRLN